MNNVKILSSMFLFDKLLYVLLYYDTRVFAFVDTSRYRRYHGYQSISLLSSLKHCVQIINFVSQIVMKKFDDIL